MTPPKTRTSARQAAAKQKIAQRDSPAGSAPPFEMLTSKWTSNPNKATEKAMLVSMMAYLRDDPTVNDDLNVFRFLCRDWYILERTLHTRATMDTVKRHLLSLGIRYIHRTPDQNWHYWNDYTAQAIMDFYLMPDEPLVPYGQYQRTTEEQQSPSRTLESDNALSDTTIPTTGQARPPLASMPFVLPRHHTSQSGVAPTNLGDHNSDSLSLDDTSTDDEVVYLGTQPPVPPGDDSDTSEGNVFSPQTVVKQGFTPNITTASDDEDGFTPVRSRHSRRHRQPPLTPPTLLDTKSPASQHNPKLPPVNQPPVEILLTTPARNDTSYPHITDVINLPVQLDTLTEILQERLVEMTAHIDRKEQQMLAKIQRTEDHFQKQERKVMAERQGHRQHMEQAMKRLEDWEDNLLHRERTLDRNNSTMHMHYERYTQKFEDLQQQAEQALTAWHDGVQTTLTDKFDKQFKQQMEKIKDFATHQEQHLGSLLDGYEEHARGIQAKLLARFHTDLTQTYNNTHNGACHTEAIPHGAKNEDQVRSSDLPVASTTATAMQQQVSPPRKASRWVNVNQDHIMAGLSARTTQGQDSDSEDILPPPPTAESPMLQNTKDSTQSTTKYPAVDYHQLARLRAANTPNQLRGRDRKSVCIFYNSFVDFNRIYRIPLKILDDIRLDRLDEEDENLYPFGLRENDPQLYDDYSSAIYARLEEDGVLDPQDPLYKGLLEVYNSRRDGYALLKGILAATVMVQSKDLGALSTPPQPHPGSTPHTFASRLNDFFRGQQQCGRIYKDKEQAMMYLQGMMREHTYTAATQQLMYELQPFPDNGTLPPRFSYPTIAMTLLTHPMALRTTSASSSQSATINVTRSHLALSDTAPTGTLDTGYDAERGRSISAERRRQPGGPARPSSRHTQKQLDIQCRACATHGHPMKECKFLPRVAACIDYITNNPTDTKDTLLRYRKMMHPDAKKAAKDSYLKVLQSSCLPANTDLDDLADQLTNASSWNDGSDDYSVSICHMTHHSASNSEALIESSTHLPDPECIYRSVSTALSNDIQPVCFPDPHMLRMLPSAMDTVVIQAIPSDALRIDHHSDTQMSRMSNVIGQCARVDTRRDLADTGASVSATGRLDILHHFTTHTPYEIMGYDGTVTRAAGQGIAYVKCPETHKVIDEMFFVYIPSVDGTIISLEHHTRTHPTIHKWTQEAIPTSDSGWVTFRDANDEVVSRYHTKQDRGLYYIQDLDFHPVVPETIASCQLTHDNMNMEEATVKTRHSYSSNINCIDFTYDLDVMNTTDQLISVTRWTAPRVPSTIGAIQHHPTTYTEKQ